MGLPDAPFGSFASDNAAGVAPEVLDAIVAANAGAALAYGDDPWTRRAEQALREVFDAPVETVLCWGGTGANVVGLGCLLQPWQCVLTPATAHIVVDECGAPAHFSGATVVPVESADGKLTPAAIDEYAEWIGVEHHPQPAVISISQVTEFGTVYTVDEIAALAAAAHAAGLRVHVDGARIANAVVATGADVHTMLVDTGADVVTFGTTKNGGMYGEAVVFVDPQLATHARFVRKQAGQLPSKARFVGAQVAALLEDDLWLRLAAVANDRASALAARVRDIEGVRLAQEPEANSLFVTLPTDRIRTLQQWSFFWEWDLRRSLVRWMTSFATTEADVDTFARGVDAILRG